MLEQHPTYLKHLRLTSFMIYFSRTRLCLGFIQAHFLNQKLYSFVVHLWTTVFCWRGNCFTIPYHPASRVVFPEVPVWTYPSGSFEHLLTRTRRSGREWYAETEWNRSENKWLCRSYPSPVQRPTLVGRLGGVGLALRTKSTPQWRKKGIGSRKCDAPPNSLDKVQQCIIWATLFREKFVLGYLCVCVWLLYWELYNSYKFELLFFTTKM